ncbi:MAG: argininosuccinate synthase [Acidobacteria bacterium]|nr:argininosuccinate synthase [Acidobacteriota bacterium]MBI3655488.1 argininosuccinate synthase [Acidobacteriota bacterium]
MKGEIKKVMVAYSGGLDTSIIIPWLRENYRCEVIAICGNIGQEDEIDGLEEKALQTGAAKLYIEDLRAEFITNYIYPTLRSGAIYEHKYLLGTAMARPLLAKRQVEIALQEGADALVHGCTGKGNDQVRFELAYKALAPQLKVIAPWREWNIVSREDAIEYAERHKVPLKVTKEKIYSRDRNIWHVSHEGGPLEDPAFEPREDMFQLSLSPELATDTPTYVELGLEEGRPVSINGEKLDPITLLTKLNVLGGANGIGRADLVENRLVGMKSRGVYETPGGTILTTAHRELEALTLDRETAHYKQLLGLKYAELVYNGQWFTPLREALDAFVDITQKTVTGTITLKLYKGNLSVAARKSQYSLYRHDLAMFNMQSDYDQRDAAGFINLLALPIKVRAMMERTLMGELERDSIAAKR